MAIFSLPCPLLQDCQIGAGASAVVNRSGAFCCALAPGGAGGQGGGLHGEEGWRLGAALGQDGGVRPADGGGWGTCSQAPSSCFHRRYKSDLDESRALHT